MSSVKPSPWVFSEKDGDGNVFPVIYSASCEPGRNLVAILATRGHLSGNYKCNRADGEFIVMARNAYEIMVRRGWSPIDCGDEGWTIYPGTRTNIATGMAHLQLMRWSDPFLAIVEADKWYRENIENRGTQ